MLLHVGHQGADDEKRGQKGGGGACDQKGGFGCGKDKAKFEEFQEGVTQHHGDGEKKGEFCGGRAADPQRNGSDDGGTGT